MTATVWWPAAPGASGGKAMAGALSFTLGLNSGLKAPEKVWPLTWLGV